MATTLIPTDLGKITHELDATLCFFENYDACSECTRNFVSHETTYLGKYEGNTYMHTCGDCSEKMVELAYTSTYIPRNYVVPKKDAILWRYMDFAKYVSILSTQSLFFNSADGFEDKFEGVLSEASAVEAWRAQFIRQQRHMFSQLSPDVQGEELENRIKGNLEFTEIGFKMFRKIHCVNCWHENEGESVAMWDLYSKDYSNAVAIKTTYQKLYEALGKDLAIHIGRVNYIDYRTSFPADVNDLFFYKRKSYAHEREVRAVVQDAGDEPSYRQTKGLSVPVDLRTLIEGVYISPKAPERLIKLVDSVNGAFGFEGIPIYKSDINEIPY
jgi:hypothetical protein